MNNYFTLIYLIRELKEKITGGIFRFAISPHRDVLELYLETGPQAHRLIFSANPAETALFLDRYRPPKKSNVIEFFKPLEDRPIRKVELAEYDRLVYLYIEEYYLLFKLFSGSPNVFLVQSGSDGEDVIVDSFKNPDRSKGESPPEPYAPSFGEVEDISDKAKPKNQVTTLNPLLPRNLLPHLIRQHDVDEMAPEEVEAFTERISDKLVNDPHPRVLKNGDVTLWPPEVLDLPAEKEFDSVNDCVCYAYRNAVHLRRLQNKKEHLLRVLERAVARKESELEELNQADKSLERADQYEKFGHLLMAHAHEPLQPGTDQIEVKDLYEDQEPVAIPLKEGMSIADNAGYYYEKARKSRKSYKEARKRIPAVEQSYATAKQMLEELKGIEHLPDLEKWIKQNDEVLSRFGYGTGDDSQAVSPYRKFQVGKYEVWVGKSAKSNDQLTSLAHKEDIWLHAREISGSHVVIRMGNRNDYPPKEVILRAAGIAAFYSKGKGMKSVPVLYTKKKYVRKPKGAAPGAVVVERERVELVPPTDPGKMNL